MISANFNAKLIDFGDSLIEGEKDPKEDEHKDDDTSTAADSYVEFRAHDNSNSDDEAYSPMSEYRGTFVGTPLYVAPEMLQKTISGHFTDLWALGCIVYEMYCGVVPFRGSTDLETFDAILKGGVQWPDGIDADLKHLIEQLLQIEPMQRLGAGLPGSDNSYVQLKAHPFFAGVDWDTVSKPTELPFDKSEFESAIAEERKKNAEHIFGDVAVASTFEGDVLPGDSQPVVTKS